MYFKSACFFQHANQVCYGGSTDNRVVHKHNTFSFYNSIQHTQLQMNTGFSLFLSRFDKSSADIRVLIKCKSEWNTRFFRKSFGSRKTGFRNAGDKICLHRIRFCKGFTATYTCVINLYTVHGTVQSCKIDIFKNTVSTFFHSICKSPV